MNVFVRNKDKYMSKTIMAFGDSLTWGTNPVAGGRHDYHDRWPSVLEAGLGATHRVVAEGLGGRVLPASTRDPAERRLLNVVEEMALASGIPAPPVYVMDDEMQINAFAGQQIAALLPKPDELAEAMQGGFTKANS